MTKNKPLIILVDTREKKPLFRSSLPIGGVCTIDTRGCIIKKAAVRGGDYAFEGLQGVVGIERKVGIDELAACVAIRSGRSRLGEQLRRLSSEYSIPILLTEDSASNIMFGEPKKSTLSGNVIFTRTMSICLRFGVMPIFAGGRVAASRIVITIGNAIWDLKKRRVREFNAIVAARDRAIAVISVAQSAKD